MLVQFREFVIRFTPSRKTTFFKLYAMLAPMVDHTETDEPEHTKSDTTAEAMTILAEICTAART